MGNQGEYLKNGAHWTALYKRSLCYSVFFMAGHNPIEKQIFPENSSVNLRLF